MSRRQKDRLSVQGPAELVRMVEAGEQPVRKKGRGRPPLEASHPEPAKPAIVETRLDTITADEPQRRFHPDILAMIDAAPVDPNPARRMLITPAMAKAFIQHNRSNRNISNAHVQWFARQIVEGTWDANNTQSIKFSTDHALIDGQHRLLACILADQPIEVDVKMDVPVQAQDTIDVGRSRTISDQLAISGERYGTQIAGSIRWIYALANESYAYKTSTPEVMSFLREHPNLRESIAKVQGRRGIRGTIPTLLIAIHYIATHVLNEGEKADAFVAVFKTGENAYKSDPAHRVREMYRDAKEAHKTIGQARLADLTIHAWNLFRQGKSGKALRPPADVRIEGFDPARLGISAGGAIPSRTVTLGDGTRVRERA